MRMGTFSPDCDLLNPYANLECGQISNLNLGKTVPGNSWSRDEVLDGFGVRPYNWQATVALEQELAEGVALRVGYYRRWFGNLGIGEYPTMGSTSGFAGGGRFGTNGVVDNVSVVPADYNPFCVTAPVDSATSQQRTRALWPL